MIASTTARLRLSRVMSVFSLFCAFAVRQRRAGISLQQIRGNYRMTHRLWPTASITLPKKKKPSLSASGPVMRFCWAHPVRGAVCSVLVFSGLVPLTGWNPAVHESTREGWEKVGSVCEDKHFTAD